MRHAGAGQHVYNLLLARRQPAQERAVAEDRNEGRLMSVQPLEGSIVVEPVLAQGTARACTRLNARVRGFGGIEEIPRLNAPMAEIPENLAVMAVRTRFGN